MVINFLKVFYFLRFRKDFADAAIFTKCNEACQYRFEADKKMAQRTGLEPATPGVTGRYSNRLNYRCA
jgi:hypothetical protein